VLGVARFRPDHRIDAHQLPGQGDQLLGVDAGYELSFYGVQASLLGCLFLYARSQGPVYCCL
jgi:hypothetical protein